MLKIGAAGAFGFGVSLPQLLQRQAQAVGRSADDISLATLNSLSLFSGQGHTV